MTNSVRTPTVYHPLSTIVSSEKECTQNFTAIKEKIQSLRQMVLTETAPDAQAKKAQRKCAAELLANDPDSLLKNVWDSVVAAIRLVFNCTITDPSQLEEFSNRLRSGERTPAVENAQIAIQKYLSLEKQLEHLQKQVESVVELEKTSAAPPLEKITPAKKKKLQERLVTLYNQYVKGQKDKSAPTPLKAELHHLDKRAKYADSYLHKMYFNELKAKMSKLPAGVSPADFLASVDRTAARLEGLAKYAATNVDDLIKRLENETPEALIPEADQLYRFSMEFLVKLKELPGTKVQKALYTGRLVSTFRRLDDAFSAKQNETLHRYCSCHVKPKGEDGGLKLLAPGVRGRSPGFLINHQPHQVPPGEIPDRTSAVIFSQSYGGGHNVVQRAMGQRIAERGGHAYDVEADDEVFEAYYRYKAWTGKTGAEWSEFFLRNNCFRTIRFLGWLSSGRDGQKTLEAKTRLFALSLLERGQQDLAMICFQRGTSPAEKAASRLGMGTYEVATDLDYQVFDFEKDAENPHYVHAMMASDPEKEKVCLQKTLLEGQYAEAGFPVRDAFLKQYTRNELQAIREKYRQSCNLAPDARVVILLCGGAGVGNTIPETLMEKYPKDGPKVHLFAICGRNEERRKDLAEKFQQLNQNNLQATAFGWTDETTLGELFAMGALEDDKGLLISAKAGGGTVSEGVARGIPMLVSEMSGIHHEQLNLDFVVSKKLGQAFNNERELPEKMVDMLTQPYNPLRSPTGEAYSDFRSKEKSMQLVNTMVRDCRADTDFQALQNELSQKLPRALATKVPDGIESVLRKFGWTDMLSEDLLRTPKYREFLELLYDSRVIYAIRGYETSLQHTSLEMRKGIQMIDGQPHLLKNGEWVSWRQIMGEFTFDRSTGFIDFIRDNADAPWVYMYPNGLVPQTPESTFNPVHQLSEQELDALYQIGQKFSSGKNEPALSKENCAYVQIFTNKGDVSDHLFGHVSIRLIDKQGKVYSIGIRPHDEVRSPKKSTVLGTYNGMFYPVDYQEFKKFAARRVTTVPVSLETFDRIFEKMRAYGDSPLKFNFINQNCGALATDILEEAGLEVDFQSSSVSESLFHVLAPKGLHRLVEAAQRVLSKVPAMVQFPILFIASVITYIPSKILTLVKNLLLYAFGAGKEAVPLRSCEGKEFAQCKNFTARKRLFEDWKDFFKEQPGSVTWKLVDWQMKQGSTNVHKFTGSKLYIVPETA